MEQWGIEGWAHPGRSNSEMELMLSPTKAILLREDAGDELLFWVVERDERDIHRGPEKGWFLKEAKVFQAAYYARIQRWLEEHIERLLGDAPWYGIYRGEPEHVDTGGGCGAVMIMADDTHYVLITDDNCQLPSATSDVVIVGLYEGDPEDEIGSESPIEYEEFWIEDTTARERNLEVVTWIEKALRRYW